MRLVRSTKAKNKAVWAVVVLLALVALLAPAVPPAGAQSAPAGRYYPQTGKTLAPEFIQFYDTHGGLSLFGYPLTDAEIEGGVKAQYLERARVEYHPENRGSVYEVQLGLLGSILTSGRSFSPAAPTDRAATQASAFFPETEHSLAGEFLRYWRQNGGLALFGYPISEPFEEGGYAVQYFERNRFELHPEASGTPYEVQLGLLGRDLLAQRVTVSSTSVSLPTYGYERAFTYPGGDPLAPYPRLDMARVTPPTMKRYSLIVLENRYLRLSVMPDLGGRLYDVVYKPTGHSEMYRNPVIKPSTFGERGWWLAAGGQEWAAPTAEHGLMEYLPWNALISRGGDGGATVTVAAVDRLTGLQITGAVTLSPEESSYVVSARIENRTSREQKAQLWTNAMLAPGGTNHASPRTRFVLPTQRVTVHSTGDPMLLAEHEAVSWPSYGGRDLSNSSTWHGWLGAFALPSPSRGSFAAIYNPDADEGMVKTFENAKMPGLKIFGFGPGFDPQVYTDDDSSYVELWGGITPTFWDNALFSPGTALGWTERWQPVAGTGGVALAGDWGTVGLDDGRLSILPVKRIEGGTVALYSAGGVVTKVQFSAAPGRPALLPVGEPLTRIEITGADGKVLLAGSLLR